MVDAVVEHDYEAHESDELNLKKGDIIHNITIKSGGWWEGTLQRLGKRGMFPDNFVKVLGGDKKTLNSAQSPSINKTLSGRKCKVLFNYSALAEDELDLNVGDIIDITGEVEEGWWKGKLKNRVGVFPSNFVSLIGDSNENNTSSNDSLNTSKIIDETTKLLAEESKDASVNMSKTKENSSAAAELNEHLPALPPKPSKEMCKVLYGYKAANEDELSLEEGDVITIITKDAQDPGWWKGELKGKIGVFPDNFVKIITPVEEAKPDRPTKVTKGKESISKSSSSASVYSSSSSIAVSRKFSDSIRPCVSVKPLLPPPPPLKKPSLSPVDSGKQQSGSTGRLSDGDIKPSLIKQFEQEKSAKLSDVPTSASRPSVVNSVTSTTVQQSSKQQNMAGGGTRSEREQHHVASSGGAETKWTVIETSDSADGISWSSSRQSYSVTSNVISSSTSSSVLSSSSSSVISAAGGERERELDLDLVSRSAMLTHPTASRAKVPKRRLPSTLLTREDSRESCEGEGMVNGNVEPSPPVQEKQANRPPWVEELKLNQAKKSQVGGGKTRVLIGGGSSGGDTGISTGISTASSTVSSEVSRVALRQVPITAQRPLSLQPGSRLLSNDHQLSDSSSSITLSVAQWNQLCEKVSKLESEVEDQRREFGKTLKELMDTIEAQAHKQKKILSDLERLTDLVTQV